MIKQIKALDKAAKKGPWYPQGAKTKSGAPVYRIMPPEENLLITLRNNNAELIEIIEGE